MQGNFYILEYQSGERGCPTFFNADLNHDWQWDDYDPNPEKFIITESYTYKAKHQVIDFDFGDRGHPVSEDFINTCDNFNMNYRSIPVEIIQSTKKPTQKKYFFLLTKDYKTIIDLKNSEYEVSRTLETGEIFTNKNFPENPDFEFIKKFVIDTDKIKNLHIFRCTDLDMKYVCSQEFKDACISRNLKGIKFTPIDEKFQSIPYWMSEQK